MQLSEVILLSYLSWLAMGFRTNTIAHALRFHSLDAQPNELKGEITKLLAFGVRLAVEQCKIQFKWDRWNCPIADFARRYENPATKEMAFVSAATSAGIVHAVTRSCSRGTVPICSCAKDSPPPPDLDFTKSQGSDEEDNNGVQTDWRWKGCSDDVAMGSIVAQTFLSQLEGTSVDVLSQVNLHNSKLGQIVVRESVKPGCKCHGISGSCTVKTCWRKVEPFSEIAEKLKHKYLRALRIQHNSPRHSLSVSESTMVFANESPDYCKPNTSTGWPGTGGRECSRGAHNSTDRSEKRSCRELCRACGHQVKRRRVESSWSCNCSFQWCCSVKCTTCRKTVLKRYCDDAPRRR